MPDATRTEHDLLGQRAVPADALWGIHTLRATENFPLAGRPVHPALVRAYGTVKLAAIRANGELGVWREDPDAAQALQQAAREMADDLLTESVRVDALQGGAGTSLNMNVNEVLANRALRILGEAPGTYTRISPLDDVNRHQSTNDTFPTALRLAAIRGVETLETRLVALQEAFQEKEKAFAHIVKVGRTEMQDAVLVTLGREMGAWAEAVNRDRWRVYKCVERLRVVNLGGTAVGTGLAAPRAYIFRVADLLREETGIGFARAENLIEATQNADSFVEVSGILTACAATLGKVAADLRLLSSGPEAGLGEIRLPPRQAGSSIMPGTVNPVIPEAVTQVSVLVTSPHPAVASAAAPGALELNAFLPLVAHCILESLDLLARAADILRRHCVEGITADEARCRAHVEASTALATALLPALGYAGAAVVAERAAATGRSIREVAVGEGHLTEEAFDALVTPEAVCRLGMPESPAE